METQPNTPSAGGSDHQAHEQQLAAALRDLLKQVDVADYRDRQGRTMRESPAFQKAQALVEHFGLTHQQLCATLDECDLSGDLTDAARKLRDLRTAKPTDVPPEYNTWHTGP